MLAAARKRAAEEGTTVTALMIRALDRLLHEPRPKKSLQLPLICPASIKAAKAGRNVTAKDIRAAEEEADIDYADRWLR